MVVFKKKILYDIFMRHAKKVAESDTSAHRAKPVTKGIKHLEDGSAVVTDGHRLYFIKDIHDRKDGAVLSPSKKEIQGEYPPIKNLFSRFDAVQTLTLDTDELFEAVDAIYSVGKMIDGKPILEFAHDSIKYYSAAVNYKRQYAINFVIPCRVNAEYLLDALKLFKDFKCETLKISFYAINRPIEIFSADEIVKTIVLPVRKY